MLDFLRDLVARSASPEEARSWGGPAAAPTDDARRLLDRWEQRIRQVHPDPRLFDQRLQQLGLDRTTALEWLTPRPFPATSPLPSWAEALGEALAPAAGQGEPFPAAVLLRRLRQAEDAPAGDHPQFPVFPEFVRPFLQFAFARLRQRAEFDRWLEPAAVEDAARFLAHRLSGLAGRTLAHEMKALARSHQLAGDTPEQRYADFMQRVVGTPDGQLALFRKYPVLARLLAVRSQQTCTNLGELVQRLDQDAAELARCFHAGQELGRVVQLECGLSDPHHHGRTVISLRFTSGLRLVYKPRSLRHDGAYAALLEWYNRQPGAPTLRCARVLGRAGYGWTEYIEALPCTTRAEVGEYYRRQGAHAALFLLLQGSDFHGENFIAHGAFPVPIDLECLLTPIRANGPDPQPEVPACWRPLQATVLGTGMAPMWKPGDDGQVCSVESGICGTADRPWTSSVSVWTGLGTDQLTLRLESRQQLGVRSSLPRLDGQEVSPEAFLGDLGEGFSACYRLLTEQRDFLLAPGGLLAAFRDLPSRCLLRTTGEYTFLLHWATAPDHLTSGPAHDLAYELLAKFGSALGNSLDLIDSEKRELWRRDVPIYAGRPGERRLTNAAGAAIGPELERSCYEQLARSLAAADEDSLAWQRELLGASLRMTFEPATGTPAATADPLLAEALRLGGALERLALHCPQGATWLTLEAEPHDPRAVGLGVVQSGLYAGGAGIALFLANLAATAHEPRLGDLARAALRFEEAYTDQLFSAWPEYRQRVAGFASPYALAYALAECGRVLADGALLDRARQLVQRLDEQPPVPNPDFLNGAAGVVRILLQLHRLTGDEQLLERACHLAANIAAGPTGPQGQGWRIPHGAVPLLGLGHGQTGIALALDSLARVRPLPWVPAAIAGALEYEATHFNDLNEDWPMLGSADGSQHYLSGWCNGACGHGLARLELLGGVAEGPPLRRDLDRALTATRRSLGLAPHNLCCGEPGRLWFLAEAGRLLERPALIREAQQAALALVAERHEQGRWHLRPVSERDTLPTLMGGIAGIGLALLQVRQPGTVSQVLTLG